MSNTELDYLRGNLDKINKELLQLISQRGEIAIRIGEVKKRHGMHTFDPKRERHILDQLKKDNKGPFDDRDIAYIFKQIFKKCLDLQNVEADRSLLVSKKADLNSPLIKINDQVIGGSVPTFIFGPCSIESYEQVEEVAVAIKKSGHKFIRGGAFKPRTSPYDFQGLGIEGLKIIRDVANKYELLVVSEVMSSNALEDVIPYIDILQVGARNMQNFDLLRSVGAVNKPVILKRGMAATIEEFIMAAEYVMLEGNKDIILCERGIRTYEKTTRNTLDITSVPILKRETHLPVLVDVSHATGRKDLLIPAAKAALAIAADGIMLEVHPDPEIALSDAQQQINITEFYEFVAEIMNFSIVINNK